MDTSAWHKFQNYNNNNNISNIIKLQQSYISEQLLNWNEMQVSLEN